MTDQDDEPLEPLKPLKTETAQDKTRKEALAWFMSGRLKQSESRFSEALSDYQMAVKLDPNAVEVYRALVPLAFALSETDKGLQYAQKAIELDPQDLDILRMLAEQLHEQQQLGKAAEYLSRAANSSKLKKDTPTYVLLQLQLAALYMEMTRQDKGNAEQSLFDKAADAYIVVLDARRHPTKYNLDFQTRAAARAATPARYELMGDVLMVARRTAQAIQAFEAAAKANHEHPGALSFSLAQAYFQAKQYEPALKNLQVYLDAQLQGKGRQPYELLARILKATGKSSELVSRVQDLAKADPRNATLQYFLADEYVAAGRLKDAEELIQRVMKESHDTEGYVSLAVIYRKENKPQELLEVLAKGLKGQRGTNRLDQLLARDPGGRPARRRPDRGRPQVGRHRQIQARFFHRLSRRPPGRTGAEDGGRRRVLYAGDERAARIAGPARRRARQAIGAGQTLSAGRRRLEEGCGRAGVPGRRGGERIKLDLYVWLARGAGACR